MGYVLAALLSKEGRQAPRLLGFGGELSHGARTAAAGGAWLGAMDERGRWSEALRRGTAVCQGSLFRDTQPEWWKSM